jgi:hypothetical protein
LRKKGAVKIKLEFPEIQHWTNFPRVQFHSGRFPILSACREKVSQLDVQVNDGRTGIKILSYNQDLKPATENLEPTRDFVLGKERLVFILKYITIVSCKFWLR